MATAAILKNRKIAIFWPGFGQFRTNFAWWRSSVLLSRPTVKNVNFLKSKMAAAAILKNQKIATYLCCGLADFDKIWQADAVRSFWAFRPLKFLQILKIQDGSPAVLRNRKIVISRPWFDRFRRNLTRWRMLTLLTVLTVKVMKLWKKIQGPDLHTIWGQTYDMQCVTPAQCKAQNNPICVCASVCAERDIIFTSTASHILHQYQDAKNNHTVCTVTYHCS